ncbi:agamous-like MADS-box protein AGL62 [Coffea eugenioides]|uniref:agamous-like MADS-box protein AGL62 n=1 Tax=Coffea eugenioides TaxID=49369 RepID=UPI000F60B247|nr:agamous-like MADS-box protein AGL62 [Coffea eugenioides]
MEKKNNLHATFSKCRNDLFMKANQLCTLNGAELALLVFSPGKKAYAFGHSSFESVTDKFLGNKPSPSIHGGTYHHVVANHHGDNISELNKIIDLKKQLKANKKCEEVLVQMIQEGQHKNWWQAPIEEMNLEQLLKLKKALKGLKKKVEDEVKRRI